MKLTSDFMTGYVHAKCFPNCEPLSPIRSNENDFINSLKKKHSEWRLPANIHGCMYIANVMRVTFYEWSSFQTLEQIPPQKECCGLSAPEWTDRLHINCQVSSSALTEGEAVDFCFIKGHRSTSCHLGHMMVYDRSRLDFDCEGDCGQWGSLVRAFLSYHPCSNTPLYKIDLFELCKLVRYCDVTQVFCPPLFP